jgi:aspartyl-tRNA(Asn)/glutamyl-tRNA(Gln) amidotransferase subunit A
MALSECSATDLRQKLDQREISAAELAREYLDAIESQNPRLQAFLRVDRDRVLEQATQVDRRRAAGDRLGKLAGVPIAVKDILCERGERATCGSRILENFRAPYDATVIARLRDADAVLLGRTNLDEFAMGSSTENSAFGPTRNPWNTTCVPGGSSGGSAAAVAARLAPLALGTDTGGSIRQPAAFCGVTGLKPSYGRVSRYGLIAFASSLDQVGPFANSAADAALLLEVIAGHDANDSTSADRPVPPYSERVSQPLAGLRLGIVREHMAEGVDSQIIAAVEESLRVYERLGARIQEVTLPHNRYSVATYYIIAPSEASSNLARFDGVHYGYRTDVRALADDLAAAAKKTATAGGPRPAKGGDGENLLVEMYRRTRSEGFGAEVQRRIMLGTYALSAGYYDAYYLKAAKVRRLIRQDYDRAFESVDIIIGPATPTVAFGVGEKTDDPLSMYLGDLFTASANLAGITAMSVPCGFTSGCLPIGLQLQAPPFEEERLLRAAHMFQQETDWHQRRPTAK